MLRLRPIRREQLDAWRLFFDAASVPLGFGALATLLAAPYAAWRKATLTPGFTQYLDRRKRRWQAAGSLTLDRLEGEEAGAAFTPSAGGGPWRSRCPAGRATRTPAR